MWRAIIQWKHRIYLSSTTRPYRRLFHIWPYYIQMPEVHSDCRGDNENAQTTLYCTEFNTCNGDILTSKITIFQLQNLYLMQRKELDLYIYHIKNQCIIQQWCKISSFLQSTWTHIYLVFQYIHVNIQDSELDFVHKCWTVFLQICLVILWQCVMY